MHFPSFWPPIACSQLSIKQGAFSSPLQNVVEKVLGITSNIAGKVANPYRICNPLLKTLSEILYKYLSIGFLSVKNSQHGQALICSETWDKKKITFHSGH